MRSLVTIERAKFMLDLNTVSQFMLDIEGR